MYAIYNMGVRYLQHVPVRYLLVQHENDPNLYAIYNHASFLLEATQTSLVGAKCTKNAI